jgi:RNA polymerase sigma factor (TIGR02999 family)
MGTQIIDVQDLTVTAMLNSTAAAGPTRWKRLAPLVDRELQRTAALVLRQFRLANPASTFQPQELVSEFYLRLLRDQHRIWEDRRHFFSFAAAVMRSVLIDWYRARRAAKRPQVVMARSLEALLAVEEPRQPDLAPIVEMRIAIERLQSFSPRQAEVIDLHFFAGWGLDEIAERLNVSEKTVRRDWIAARAFLYAELSGLKGVTHR